MKSADVLATKRSWRAGVVLALLLAACPSAPSPAPTADAGPVPKTRLYASNAGTPQVAVFNSAWDESLPIRRIWDGSSSAPAGIAVNPTEQTLLMLYGDGSVETHPLSGGPPVRTLRGPRTHLDDCKALALGLQHGELFVSNRESITVYPVGASGDVAPLRVIAGPNTGLTRPWGLAVDELHGELYVANQDDWGPEFSIFVYAREANGDVRPKRTLAGPKTALLYPTGIALALEHDEFLVANSRSVTVYPRLAEGDVTPSNNLPSVMGPEGAFDSLSAIAYDPVRDELSVASPTLDRLWVFPRQNTLGSDQRIRSFSSGLKGPTGLALVSE